MYRELADANGEYAVLFTTCCWVTVVVCWGCGGRELVGWDDQEASAGQIVFKCNDRNYSRVENRERMKLELELELELANANLLDQFGCLTRVEEV